VRVSTTEQAREGVSLEAQRARLASIRAARDNNRVVELLGHLESAAKGSDNLMPLFIECVEHDITLGEICGVLRRVFGEYRPAVTI
jgi:methylmalonyl-CoA mutase N-terminal domain/subunit